MEEALAKVHALPSIKENMIVSTCNRVEVYAATRETEKAIHDVKDFLSRYHGVSLKDFEKSLYTHVGEEAVRHIFRVASSLDSMVLGEPQILGQIKGAYDSSQQVNTSGLILHRLLHRAFHVAKRVRTETKIAISAVSVSSVAVELAKKIFGTLEKKTVLLIGAGEMCELLARHLVSGGVEKIMVTNRTYERAMSLAQEFRGEAIPFEEMGMVVVDGLGDPEGDLLAAVRSVIGSRPLVASLDFHGNVTARIVQHADILVGYNSFPHTNLFEVGQKAATLAQRYHGRTADLRRIFIKIPMIVPMERITIVGDEPMVRIIRELQRLEDEDGMLALSAYGVQCWLDIDVMGCSLLGVVRTTG